LNEINAIGIEILQLVGQLVGGPAGKRVLVVGQRSDFDVLLNFL